MSRPGKVVQVADGVAEVEIGGRRARFNALMVPEARAGDWVLTHTGLVVSVITEADAAATEKVIGELRDAGASQPRSSEAEPVSSPASEKG